MCTTSIISLRYACLLIADDAGTSILLDDDFYMLSRRGAAPSDDDIYPYSIFVRRGIVLMDSYDDALRSVAMSVTYKCFSMMAAVHLQCPYNAYKLCINTSREKHVIINDEL